MTPTEKIFQIIAKEVCARCNPHQRATTCEQHMQRCYELYRQQAALIYAAVVEPLEQQWRPMNPSYLKQFSAISDERDRQNEKWGQQKHDNETWLAILVEEVGEVAKAICEKSDKETQTELIHVAAVAVQWLERFEEGKT